ncbi:MAG TPA: trypsin-like peptidase domain-containing protein [Microbacterium sp.]|nr:trypsin-like peptidase domain-containing protein [Microbacterium sp.]
MSEQTDPPQQLPEEPAAQTPTHSVGPERSGTRLRPRLLVGAAAGAVVLLGIGAALGVVAVSASRTSAGSQSQGPGAGFPGYGSGGSASGGSGAPGGGSGSGSQTTAVTGTAATTAQSRGIALIDTTVDYGQAEAAGTGMVVTSAGEILTNNHVVEGATKITVEIASTGRTYTATVVGTDAADDVAVLQLQNASGLTTATFDTSRSVQVGDSVTGVGNAQGGGKLLAASGSVTALDQSLTTQAEGYAASEMLRGMIETNAAIQSGDSGGPLYDSNGGVVGMDTAASSGGVADSFAIPITTALSIADEITSGTGGSGIQLGTPAFLGVEVAPADAQSGDGFGYSGGAGTSGATVSGVIDGTPAAEAGLQAGDVITAVDGTAVGSSSDLSGILKQHKAGERVTITYTDASGQTRSVHVTLISGPAA